MESTALVRQGSPDPMSLIAMAIERGVSSDQLGDFFALQERHERNQAEGAFARALTAFQAKMPAVHRGKSVDGKYNYATFESIMDVAAPLLRECGIVITFDTSPVPPDLLMVTCKVRVGIHAEPTTVVLPIPPGNKAVNATQVFGQAVSYGKRYALCAALNIVTTNEDPDAETTAEIKAALIERMQAAKTATEIDAVAADFKAVKAQMSKNEQEEVIAAGTAARERVKTGTMGRIQEAVAKVIAETPPVEKRVEIPAGDKTLAPSTNGHAITDGVNSAHTPTPESVKRMVEYPPTPAPDATAAPEDPVVLEARLTKLIEDAETAEAFAAARAEAQAHKAVLPVAAWQRIAAVGQAKKAALEKKPDAQPVS